MIDRTHFQFIGMAITCFFQLFYNRVILGDKRLKNLKAPVEKANLYKGYYGFHKTRLFLPSLCYHETLKLKKMVRKIERNSGRKENLEFRSVKF